MAATITKRYSGPSGTRELAYSFEASATGGIRGETVANGQTDKQLNIAIDVSAVKGFWLESDQDVTFETNDGSTPDNTISLLAGKPYVWDADSYDAFLLDTDVTAVFITNASGAAATIWLLVDYDATP